MIDITRRKEWFEPEYPHRGIPTLDDGATDHRGLKWPITGCRCNACLSTAGSVKSPNLAEELLLRMMRCRFEQ